MNFIQFRKFSILLGVQIAFPMIFINIPMIACIISDVFFRKFPDQWLVQLGFTIIDLYAVSSALFTLFFITPYRHHFFKLIRLRQTSSKSTVNPVVTMQMNKNGKIKPTNLKVVKLYKNSQNLKSIS